MYWNSLDTISLYIKAHVKMQYVMVYVLDSMFSTYACL